jgi:hypothetical protein
LDLQCSGRDSDNFGKEEEGGRRGRYGDRAVGVSRVELNSNVELL